MEREAVCVACHMELSGKYTTKLIENARKAEEPATNKRYLDRCSTKNCNKSGVLLPPSL